MCIKNPLKISDFQGNLLHMLLFSQKHALFTIENNSNVI